MGMSNIQWSLLNNLSFSPPYEVSHFIFLLKLDDKFMGCEAGRRLEPVEITTFTQLQVSMYHSFIRPYTGNS